MIETSQHQYDVKEQTQDIPTYAEVISQTRNDLASLKDEIEKDDIEPTIEQIKKDVPNLLKIATSLDDLVGYLAKITDSKKQATALNQIYDETRKMFYEDPEDTTEKRTKQAERNKNYDTVYKLAMTGIKTIDTNAIQDAIKNKDQTEIMKAKVYISILSTAPRELLVKNSVIHTMIDLISMLGGTIIDVDSRLPRFLSGNDITAERLGISALQAYDNNANQDMNVEQGLYEDHNKFGHNRTFVLLF